MKVTASAKLKAEIEEELKIPDPAPEKAEALLCEDDEQIDN